jgi:hypothetical protein
LYQLASIVVFTTLGFRSVHDSHQKFCSPTDECDVLQPLVLPACCCDIGMISMHSISFLSFQGPGPTFFSIPFVIPNSVIESPKANFSVAEVIE